MAADAIVVGAGPVGLTAALALSQGGLQVQVLEAARAIDRRMRASTFHPPTLDQIHQLGLSHDLVSAGLKVPRWQLRQHESGESVTFDLEAISDLTGFPFRLQVEQHRYCELAIRALAELGVEVRFGQGLRSLTQNDTEVQVTCTSGDTLTTRWLIGADGANSAVRQVLGIEYGGITHRHASVLASTDFPFHKALPGLADVTYCWSRRGPFSLLRLRDRWRVSLYPGTEDVEDAASTERVRAWLQYIHPDAATATINNVHPYRVHQRCVSRFRQGRVLLAGDAAHLNPPSGGMGMNGGIHDATNLAEKLLAVEAGDTMEKLDQYDRQRRSVVSGEIIPQSAANRERMATTDPGIQTERLHAQRQILHDDKKLVPFLMRSSMIHSLNQAAEIG
ncbi:MAG: FAD-dependent oxidoreductase [Lysobacterales bacterium]